MGVQAQIASLAFNFMAAQQQRSAYEMEAQAYEEQAKMAEIQAKQQENERNRRLRMQLASLGTSMAAQGVEIGSSPSVLALQEDEVKIAKNDIASIKLMGMSKRRQFSLSAAGARTAGKATVLGRFAKTASGIYDISQGVSKP